MELFTIATMHKQLKCPTDELINTAVYRHDGVLIGHIKVLNFNTCCNMNKTLKTFC